VTRTIVDFGIDLGTTNSSIAVLKGTQTEVIKNNEGFEYTPSVVHYDKKDRLRVGARAKENLDRDPERTRRLNSSSRWGLPNRKSLSTLEEA